MNTDHHDAPVTGLWAERETSSNRAAASAGRSRAKPAAFCPYCSRFRGPTTTEVTPGRAATQATATAVGVTSGGHAIRGAIETLLNRAQRAGAVREEVGMAELPALLTAACLAAQHQGWDEELRTSTPAVMFHGLRP